MRYILLLPFFFLTGCASWSAGFSIDDPIKDPYGRPAPKQCSLDNVTTAEATCAIFIKITKKF